MVTESLEEDTSRSLNTGFHEHNALLVLVLTFVLPSALFMFVPSGFVETPRMYDYLASSQKMGPHGDEPCRSNAAPLVPRFVDHMSLLGTFAMHM